MAQPDDIEARMTALETQVADLTTQVRRTSRDAAAARVLAGGADRDVTEIREDLRDFRRATTASFNAMRADLTDLQTKVDNGFAEVRGRLDVAAAGHQQIVDLITTLIERDGGQPDR
ncbi:MAG TPA: hypothetical protein VFX70_11365 [Mycobacteriales bacterium]|nr:hypothetical protein [Mycobacteriales bacterium]